MKKSFLIFAFAFLQNFVFGQKNFLDQPYLETSAKADTLITPDRIYLSIQINEADSKNKKSVETQEKEMEATLKSLGINTEKDLVLLDLASNFKNYLFKGQNILKSKRYELLVKDAVTAGKVLISLENIGISNANIDRTEYSKAEELSLILKIQAVAKTKKIAENLAKPLGQKVGKAVHIRDDFDQSGRIVRNSMTVSAKVRGLSISPEPIDIEIKKIQFEAEISVKYILE